MEQKSLESRQSSKKTRFAHSPNCNRHVQADYKSAIPGSNPGGVSSKEFTPHVSFTQDLWGFFFGGLLTFEFSASAIFGIESF